MTPKQVTTLPSSGSLTIKPCHGHFTHQFITCQHVRARTLTPKHVTLSQAMTHSNKTHNGPQSKPQQSQTGPRNRPQKGHKHRPRTIAGSPRCSQPSSRRSGLPKRVTPRLGGLESPSSLSPGLPNKLENAFFLFKTSP